MEPQAVHREGHGSWVLECRDGHAGWLAGADGAILNPLHVGELVIDGGTLSHILGTEMEQELAQVGAQCGSVVICRSSPSQKAAIVRMMSEYEMSQVRAIRDAL